MDLSGKIREELNKHYGSFDSMLEHEYETKLTKNLISGTLEDKRTWVTYNQVILELKNSLNDMIRVKELQYKLTEDIVPNEAIVEVLEDVKCMSPEIERLYYKIRNLK